MSDASTPAAAPGDVTVLLRRIEGGDLTAAEQILPLVYGELRKLAASRMAQELYAAEEAYRLVMEEGIAFREAYRRVGERYK